MVVSTAIVITTIHANAKKTGSQYDIKKHKDAIVMYKYNWLWMYKDRKNLIDI